MNLQAQSDATETPIDSTRVLDYLRDNPGFFEDNPELLSDIKLSHPSGKAVSLIERQVDVLRDQNAGLRERLTQLVQVARDNDRLNDRMHELLMALLNADSLNTLVDTLQEHLHAEFNADAVALFLAGLDENRVRESGARALTVDDRTKTLLKTPLESGKPLCGRLQDDQLQFLFGERADGLESAAVIPLGEQCAQGLVAIGSREAERFFPGMGTVFLGHLGELIGRLLNRCVRER
jgi:uncharacterized protein YigA (DUF484 family)